MRTPSARYMAMAVTLPALLLLAACSTGGGPSGSPSATPSPSATAKATTLDPCQLVTAAEASALSGVTFGVGVEENTGTNGTGKRCTYGSQTTNVFFVQVATATSASEAQADWSTYEAQSDANLARGFPAALHVNINKADLTGFGDRATVATGSESGAGHTVSAGAMYLLKGANFLAFGDVTLATAPTADALRAQAATSLARMP